MRSFSFSWLFGGAIGDIRIRNANECSAMATANALVRPQLNDTWSVESLREAISHYQEQSSEKW
jgi:hypothetical protein